MKIQLVAATYLLILFGITSCASDPYMYNAYEQNEKNSANLAKGQQMNPAMMSNPYDGAEQPAMMPPVQPYQPNMSVSQKPSLPPLSRSYSNPYAVQPSPYYNYDIDQYYVPPLGYGGDASGQSSAK